MDDVHPAQIGLVFYPDSRPGFSRRRRGRGFSYTAPDGTHVACREKRAALAALAVPPAYEDVWISPIPDGHLRATGRDAKTRKQYIYHPKLAEARAMAKFDRLGDLAKALPRIRGWITRHLAEDDDGERQAIALALALIDRYALRIGMPEYAEENGSYGATTLKPEHLRRDGPDHRLDFPAKGGKRVQRPLRGATLLRALKANRARAGETLISWRDSTGQVHPVRADAVNTTLSALCDTDITAKAFRTWSGTLAAFKCAQRPGARAADGYAQAAAHLANTPAVARDSYIHPDIIALLNAVEADPSRADAASRPATPSRPRAAGLRQGEAALAAFLADPGLP